MTFNKKLVVIMFLLVVLFAFNVSAAMKTIKGTKYTTTYDPQKLKLMYNQFYEAQTLKQGKLVPTGEIVLMDNISSKVESECLNHSTIGNIMSRYQMVNKVNKFQSCDMQVYYGTIGGKVKIINKTSMEVASTNPKKPVYWQVFIKDKKLQILSITNSKVLINKVPKKSNPKRFLVYVISRGGVYVQNKVLVCAPGSNCVFEILANYKAVTVREDALAMSMNTYKNKYKGKGAAARSKLKVWEALNITDIKWLYFYPDTKYKFSGNFQGNSGDMAFKLRGYPMNDFSVLGTLNPLKLFPDGESIIFGIIAPLTSSSNQPLYLIKPEYSNLWIEPLPLMNNPTIPDNTYLFVEVQFPLTGSASTKLPLSKQPTISFSRLTGLWVFRKSNSLSGNPSCPSFFDGYSCMIIDSQNRKVYVKPRSKDKLFSPFTTKKANYSLKINLNDFDFYNVTIDPIIIKSDMVSFSGYYAKVRHILKSGGYPSIAISKNKLIFPLRKKWYEVGYTFVAKFLTDKPNVYDVILCDHKQKKCYINGVEMSRALKTGKQCLFKKPGGSFIYFPCSKLRQCKEYITGSSKKPIKVLIVGNGYKSDVELKREIKDLLYEPQALANINPFVTNMNMFGIFYINLRNKYQLNHKKPIPEEISEELLKCPGMTVTFIVTPVDNFVRSFASGPEISLFAYKAFNKKIANRRTAIHEFGHAFASLSDEYHIHETGTKGPPANMLRNNCVAGRNKLDAKNNAIRYWTKILGSSGAATRLANEAERKGWWGCANDCDRKFCGHYLRHASNSIMKDENQNNWGPVSNAILNKRISDLKNVWQKRLQEERQNMLIDPFKSQGSGRTTTKPSIIESYDDEDDE